MLRALAVPVATLSIAVALCSCVVRAEESDSSVTEKENAANEANPRQPSHKPSAAPATNEDAAAETALLNSINQSRRQAGVAAVQMEDSLREAARLHAQRMVATRRLEHQFPGEPSLLQRIADVSLLPLDRAGENIANATCAEGAADVLMRSPPHRENLLDPQFNLIGIAAVWSDGRLYVVQDFAHVVPSYTARETARIVGHSIGEVRLSAGLTRLTQLSAPHLDDAACGLAAEDHPNARLIAASYSNRKIITYTQSQPEILPPAASRLLENADVQRFAVGSCYARNGNYPTGIYWVAILLY